MILLTPGPCMTSVRVRAASSGADLNHREPEYIDLVREVRGRLSDMTGGYHPYILGGSGTAALEAMVTSCVSTGPVLILSDGYYSDRMSDLFEIHNIPHRVLSFPWLEGWDLDVIETALRSESFEWVTMCHHETTVGRINPVEAVAEIAKSCGTKTMVDAMSSYGADPLDLTNIDVFATAPNKCFHGLPGLSIVLSQEFVPSYTPRTYYLHLARYAGENPPLTPPVPALKCFREALREHDEEGGMTGRLKSYLAKSAVVRDGLRAKGYDLPEVGNRASSLTLAPIPADHSWDSWHKYCHAKGFEIYGCKGELAEKFYQVSVMGVVQPEHIRAWLDIVPTA